MEEHAQRAHEQAVDYNAILREERMYRQAMSYNFDNAEFRKQVHQFRAQEAEAWKIKREVKEGEVGRVIHFVRVESVASAIGSGIFFLRIKI